MHEKIPNSDCLSAVQYIFYRNTAVAKKRNSVSQANT